MTIASWQQQQFMYEWSFRILYQIPRMGDSYDSHTMSAVDNIIGFMCPTTCSDVISYMQQMKKLYIKKG